MLCLCAGICHFGFLADPSVLADRSASNVPSVSSTSAAGVLAPIPLAIVPPLGDSVESTADWEKDFAAVAHEVSSAAHKVLIFPFHFPVMPSSPSNSLFTSGHCHG